MNVSSARSLTTTAYYFLGVIKMSLNTHEFETISKPVKVFIWFPPTQPEIGSWMDQVCDFIHAVGWSIHPHGLVCQFNPDEHDPILHVTVFKDPSWTTKLEVAMGDRIVVEGDNIKVVEFDDFNRNYRKRTAADG